MFAPAGNQMADSIRPKDVRLLKLKVNDRMDSYIDAIAKQCLSPKQLNDPRGFRAPAVVAAIEDWANDKVLSPDKVRLYMLEHLDAAYIIRTRVRELYLPAAAHAALNEIARHLIEHHNLALEGRGKGKYELHIVASLAVSRLADMLGAHKPLVEGDC